MKKQVKIIIPIVVVVLLVTGLLTAYFVTRKNTNNQETGKSVECTIRVEDNNKSVKEYDVKTTKQYLKDAMDELVEKNELSYELDNQGMVKEVNGVRADYALDNAYWAIYVNDNYGQNGIDTESLENDVVYTLKYEYNTY